MKQTFESAREHEAARRIMRRRQSIVTEQEREVNHRERGAMKVAFRKSDEGDRLVEVLSNELEGHVPSK